MKRRQINGLLLTSAGLLKLPRVFAAATAPGPQQALHYGRGSRVDPAVHVADAQGRQYSLLSLLGEQAAVNVLFLFGGGDMGREMPGRLWCQDSFEDSHILRVLIDKYKDRPVHFISVAVPPAHHTRFLGYPDRVFLTAAQDSDAFLQARQALVDSTQASHESGILPQVPYYDFRFRLLHQRPQAGTEDSEAIARAPWEGAFRAADESQFYGVPNFWLLGRDGEVLTAPFRGNIYHPHGGEPKISYTYNDVDQAIARLLD